MRSSLFFKSSFLQKILKMKPILYFDDRSPPVRSCLMLIKHLELDIELKSVDLFQREHLKDEFIKINPAHTVPTLKDENLILTDSHAILIYLCEKYSENSEFYPKNDSLLRIKILNKLFFENSILFRRDSDMMTEIFRHSSKDVSHHERKITETYSMIETFLNENQFIACNHMTIADLSVLATLSTVDIVFPVTADKWPRLHHWFNELKSLPYYDSINQRGLEHLKEALKVFAKFELKS